MRFRAGVSEQEKNNVAAARGARRRGNLRGGSGFERLETDAQNTMSLAAQLSTQPLIEWVEPNYLITRGDFNVKDPANHQPSYSAIPKLWSVDRNANNSMLLENTSTPAAPGASMPSQAGSGILIAVIDSGVDFSHPDLAAYKWSNSSERDNNRDDDRNGFADDMHGWDWVADNNQIRDEQGHGTGVAGIISEEIRQGLTAGESLSLMSLRVLDATGTGDVANAVEAIDYAATQGARVINISWGLESQSSALRDAIERAESKGVVVVCAAGNYGRNIDGTPYYPSSFDLTNIISVAASDATDNLASWSNWGATLVQVASPGVNIQTAKPGGGNQSMSGTSAAAPRVSGIAALLRGSYPGLGGSDTRKAIMAGVRPVAGLSGKVAAGGVADLTGALRAAGSIGNGGNGGNGNGGNNGVGNNGGGRPDTVSPPTRPERGVGGQGPNGSFDAPAASATRSAPPNFLNQDEAKRRGQTEPQRRPFIQANSMPVCDEDCGGYVPTGAGGSDPYFGTSRKEVVNRTGESDGVDSGSRNFHWQTPLLNLKGRAGLDLSISLHYNSLVWTEQGGSIQFNPDHGFPGPGFRLGFPTLQPAYYDWEVGAYAYTLITPSGGRIEMWQNGTNTYESIDGTYTHLIDNGVNNVLVRLTDGTQLTFVYNPDVYEYRCTQIKDRNGNYISIYYGAINGDSTLGRPTAVVDTAGRSIYFNYDGQNYLTSITQAWTRQTPAGIVSETHEWARFYYSALTLQPNFPGLNVIAPLGTAIPVLSRVDLPDYSSYQFEYDAAWGMVKKISHYGPDPGSRLINYTAYTFPTGSTPHADCPRVTERRDWGQDWNNNQEAVTTFGMAENVTWTMPDLSSHTGTRMTITSPVFYDKTGAARQIVNKVFAHSAGWDTGLPVLEQTYEKVPNGAETLQREVITAWTQDNTSLSYAKNPRPYELTTSDPAGNRRRTTINYTAYSLPDDVREWGGPNAAQVLRRTQFYYAWDEAFISRRIIGLPSATLLYEGESTLRSKLEYHYDWGNHFTALTPSVQHDSTNYGSVFTYGRAALVGIRRYNVNAPDDPNQAMWPRIYGYDLSGSILWTQDGAGHRTNYDYADNYANSSIFNTRAYPTKVTDPAGYFSTAQYNWHIGNTYITTDPKGYAQKSHYDSAGRLMRVTSMVNGVDGLYQRYEYDPNWGHTRSYTKTETVEAYTNTIRNGMGQVYLFVAGHPNSTGGYLATWTKYDALGRAVERSNATEITPGGTPTGDDAAGYQFMKQAYDWKGRPTLTTFPAIAGQTAGNTKEFTYGGCGCAGGESTTFRDERGRQRKLYKDALGRLGKVEELNWDASVYSTTTYAYNARDQITNINQQGQQRNFSYDGHGRMSSRATPEQGTTTYTYYDDDEPHVMTDARGATTTRVQNSRHLVSNLNYAAPSGSNVAATNNVTFDYDSMGNRTAMTERDQTNAVVGSTAYVYDDMSRLSSETRTFTNLGAYTLSYTYNMAGQLTRITNPWNVQVSYAYDVNGRVTDVKGTDTQGTPTYGGVANYAQNMRYRAFGGLKEMAYGNAKTLSLSYDERLRLKSWNVPGVLGYEYFYDNAANPTWLLADKAHRVTYARNINSSNSGGATGRDPALDRSFDYDHVGRLQYSHSGSEARMHVTGQPNDGLGYGPYSQHYYYDVWGNITQRIGWGGANASYTAAYTDNKRTGFGFDFAGNITSDGGQSFQYDVMGQQTYASGTALAQAYDGDGMRVRKTENGATTYYLRSSVLRSQVVAEIGLWNGTWQWVKGYVYVGGHLLAIQHTSSVHWVHQDPVVKNQRVTESNGTVSTGIEIDPWGGEAGAPWSWNTGQQSRKFTTYERDLNQSDEAMTRRYNRWWSRFDQPDSYEGSYDLSDPQSLNRYAYVQNDPINYTDPTGQCLAVQYSMETDSGNHTWWEFYLCNDTGGGHLELILEEPPGGGGGGPIVPAKTRKEMCNELRAQIFSKAGDLLNDLRKYDPVEDAKGGHVHRHGITSPGGHFEEIRQRRSGIKGDIARYIRECIKNNKDGNPPIPPWIDDAVNRPIPAPNVPPPAPVSPRTTSPPPPVPVPAFRIPFFFLTPLPMCVIMNTCGQGRARDITE